MAFVRKKSTIMEGRQLVGTAAQTMEVAEWVVSQGYPWLLGDATKPETLAPKNGKAGDAGIYIDPQFGELVIKTGRLSHRAAYGDWIVAHPNDGIRIIKPVFFDEMYEVVETPTNP